MFIKNQRENTLCSSEQNLLTLRTPQVQPAGHWLNIIVLHRYKKTDFAKY